MLRGNIFHGTIFQTVMLLQAEIIFTSLEFFLTLHVIVRFPTGDPFSALKSPMVRVGQNNLHKHVIMRRQVESGNIKTQERKHSPANIIVKTKINRNSDGGIHFF